MINEQNDLEKIFSNRVYIKPAAEEANGDSYEIFAADGTKLAIMPSKEAACLAAKKFDLQAEVIH